MPTYDYECAACGRRFEVVHGVHAESPTACPLCGRGPIRKVITAANVHYKGSGWAKKERRTTVTSGASKGGDSASGSEDGSKAEAPAASDAEPSGSSPKKSESGTAESTGATASKTTEKPSKSSASKTSD